jgi:hypothetical protein
MSNNLDHFVQLYLEEVPNATENELLEEYGNFKKQFVSMYGGSGFKEKIKDGLLGLIIMTFMILYQLSDTLSDITVLNYGLGRGPLSGVDTLVNMNINDLFLVFAGLIIIILIIGFIAQPMSTPVDEDAGRRYRDDKHARRQERRKQGGAADTLLEAVQKVNLDGNKLFMKAMMFLSNVFRKCHLGLDKKKAERIANGLDYIIDHPKNVKDQLIKLFKPVRAMTEKEYSMIKEILKDNKEIELNVMKMLKN